MLPIILAGVLNSVLPEIIKAIAAAPQQTPKQAEVTAQEVTQEVIDKVKQIPALKAGKPIYSSRAFWLGLFQAVGGAAVLYLSNIDFSQANLPLFAAPIISGILTILVRVVTVQPVRF